MQEEFDWLKPSPLWQPDGQDVRNGDFFKPLLLEMKTDDFMNEFFGIAAAKKPDPMQNAIATPVTAGQPLKLFQPIHGRYYLACASLCCRVPGFPDRDIRIAEGESTFLVLRKLISNAEYAWILGDAKKGQWKPVASQSNDELKKEDRLPLHPTNSGNSRSIFFGYVPVASRETYSAQLTSASDMQAEAAVQDPRASQFKENMTRPLIELLGPNMSSATAARTSVAQQTSLFLLLDLASYLDANIPPVLQALPGSGSLSGNRLLLANYLQSVPDPQHAAGNLAKAIKDVWNKKGQIELLSGGDPLPATYDLRQFGFPGADPTAKASLLETKVVAALPAFVAAAPPPAEIPKLLARPGETYLVRCVYERSQCDPLQRYVSKPSDPFELAATLDPDGPARQIRLELPRDVSIAGLRKFKKGVGFVMSDAMRNKVAMITGAEKNLLDDKGVNDEGGWTLGFLCTFSFQIIFIVAFFLLLMFVIILNIVFWWMPFFRICLPIPVKSK